jgi:hypothetical protein
LPPLHRLAQRGIAVAEIEGVRRGEGDVDAVELRRGEPLPPALVEDETRELDAVAALHAGDDLFCVGHLRYSVRADEAHGLDPRQPCRPEAVDELRSCLGRQDLGFVLKPVPRPDVAEDHPHRPSVLPGFLVTACYKRAALAGPVSAIVETGRFPITS